jgi:hypothetical protein
MTTLMTSPDQGIELGGGIKLTATGAAITGEPTIEEFCAALQNCYLMANATMWAIGDLLLYGEGRGDYGESYTQAVELTQKSYWTLSQAVWVSKAYPKSDREFAGLLSWSHHRAAARIKDLDERRTYMKRCVDESLSRDELIGILPKRITESATPDTATEEGKTHDVTCPFCDRSFVV